MPQQNPGWTRGSNQDGEEPNHNGKPWKSEAWRPIQRGKALSPKVTGAIEGGATASSYSSVQAESEMVSR